MRHVPSPAKACFALLMCIVTTLALAGGTTESSSAHRAAARELAEVSRAAAPFERQLALSIPKMKDLAGIKWPAKTAAIQQVYLQFSASMRERMSERQARLDGALANLYAEALTEQELQDLLTFFKSPVGKRYLDLLPALQKGTVALGNDWVHQTEQEFEAELARRGILIRYD
jgi:uncharacterized protein